jgi:hypothetical protein
MPVSRRRKRKEPRDVKKEQRDLKKDLVRATTIGSVAFLPLLGAFGFRASVEPTAKDATSANVIEYIEVGNGGQVKFEDLLKAQRLHSILDAPVGLGGSPGPVALDVNAEEPTLSAGLRAINYQSDTVLNLISGSHAENHSASKAAAILQAIPRLGGITVGAALATLMMLLAQYGQKVLENLLDDSAESTAKTLEKSVSKGANTLKQKFDHIISNPPSVESDQNLATEGFDYTFSPEAFAQINKLKQELSRRSFAEVQTDSKRFWKLASAKSDPPASLADQSDVTMPDSKRFWKLASAKSDPPAFPADQSGAAILGDLSTINSFYNISASNQASSESDMSSVRRTSGSSSAPSISSAPMDSATADVVRVAAQTYEDYLTQLDSESLQTDFGYFDLVDSWSRNQASSESDMPSVRRTSGSSSALSRSSAPMDSATIEAFRNAAKDAYEALLPYLDAENAENLANYLRYRVADEALNAFSSSIHILALQRIVDAKILSSLNPFQPPYASRACNT